MQNFWKMTAHLSRPLVKPVISMDATKSTTAQKWTRLSFLSYTVFPVEKVGGQYGWTIISSLLLQVTIPCHIILKAKVLMYRHSLTSIFVASGPPVDFILVGKSLVRGRLRWRGGWVGLRCFVQMVEWVRLLQIPVLLLLRALD